MTLGPVYVIAVPSWPQGVGDRLEAFRRVHDPGRAAIVPAHVTLVFGVTSIGREELAVRTANIAARTPSFAVTLDKATVHEDRVGGGFNLFLLVGEGAAALTTLHRDLYAGRAVSDLRTDVPYQPHVTVASAQTLQPVQRAFAEASVLRLPLRGSIEALTVCTAASGKLETLATLALKQRSLQDT